MEPYSQAETLQKLERLTQLETMVAELRIRIEKYRTMYETIKTEHADLEEVKSRKENELTSVKDEMLTMQKRFQELLNQARMETDVKIQECEELRMHVLTPQRVEVLRVKLQEEAEASYKQKLETADLELDKYRSDFNKLRYEYSFLKSEYEHEQNRTKTILEELRAQHQIEIEVLNKDKEDLIDQLRRMDEQNDAQKIRILQKDNAQLNMKVKSLLDELDEIREKREASGLQSDHVSRLQARQLTELSGHCKSLEMERDGLKMQLDRVQNELERTTKQQDTASHNLILAERENQRIRGEMEELIHTHKVEMSDLKLSLTRDKGELERQCDTLNSQAQTNKNRILVLQQNIDDLKEALSRKEEEIALRVQEVKEKEWEKISKLENYKLQAESQLAENERQRSDLESTQNLRLEKLNEQMKKLADEKEKVENELSVVKMELSQRSGTIEELNDINRQYQELKNKQQKLQHDFESAVTNGEEMKNSNEKLQNKLELMKRELKNANEDVQKQQEGFQRNIQETKKKIEQQKKEIEKERKEWKKQLQEADSKAEKTVVIAKKKIKKQKSVIEDLLSKIEAQRAQGEKLEAENRKVVQNLTLENDRVKRALERIRKRQNQFTHLLNVGSASIRDQNPPHNPLLAMSFEPPKERTSSKMERDFTELSPMMQLDQILDETPQ